MKGRAFVSAIKLVPYLSWLNAASTAYLEKRVASDRTLRLAVPASVVNTDAHTQVAFRAAGYSVKRRLARQTHVSIRLPPCGVSRREASAI
jgi:hypothetical protein